MAEGSVTYMGLAIPIFGEYEQTQTTLATDMVSLTGATSISGDFIACQNSTGAEKFVVSSSGLITSAVGLALSGSVTATQQQLTVSATTMVGGMNVVVSSTGALEALGTTVGAVSGVVVSPDSDAIMNAAFVYAGGSTATGNTAISMLASMGANSAPSYFLAVGATAGDAIYKGAIGDQGFLDASMAVQVTYDCDMAFVGVKCLVGSATIYMLALRSTSLA